MSAAEGQVIKAVEGFADPLLASMDIELVDIEFRREGHGWVLRLYIDMENGVNLDDCAKVSREVSAYLEVENIIEHAFHLEVSSPGVERPLKKKEDFVRFTGRKARIKLRHPQAESDQRVFTGILDGVEGESVVLIVDGEKVCLDMEGMSKARLSL